MQQALELAHKAQSQGEIPVGAIVVKNGKLIGQGYNRPISRHDPCAHAEIIALRDAAKNSANYRLVGATLYVTLEPCLMCAGAMVHARINHIVFGADDPKTGVISSVDQIYQRPYLNHKPQITAGVLAADCSVLLKDFFKNRRRG